MTFLRGNQPCDVSDPFPIPAYGGVGDLKASLDGMEGYGDPRTLIVLRNDLLSKQGGQQGRHALLAVNQDAFPCRSCAVLQSYIRVLPGDEIPHGIAVIE